MQTGFLELKSITKRYAENLAVDGASLSIPKGCIYGLLGPNGAGKTTIIRMITSITAPDSGEIRFDGVPMKEDDNERIGYMPEERGLYKKMKVREQLVYLLKLKGLRGADAKSKVTEWMDHLDIEDWAFKEISELSKGMQQKVQFIATVAHNPPLLILDEPFSGLDPINTQIIEEEIRTLNAAGTTIIFSTHRMEQVEELCDRIALINKGKVVLEDDLQTARKKFMKNQFHIEFTGDKKLLENLEGTTLLELNTNNALVELGEGKNIRFLMQALLQTDLEILKLEQHIPRLNEIFIEIVQGAESNA